MDHKTLVVADWSVDAEAVVSALQRRSDQHPHEFQLLVPAWLHGLDWAGDSTASMPCAHLQAETITHLAAAAGLRFAAVGVGDPDVGAAVLDALGARRADDILLCMRPRRLSLSHPLDLAHRIERLTKLPVGRVEIVPVASMKSGRACTEVRPAPVVALTH
jgi:hypothetical protein